MIFRRGSSSRTVHTRFSVVSHVRVAAGVDESIRTDSDRHADSDPQDHTTCKPWFNHLPCFAVDDIRRSETFCIADVLAVMPTTVTVELK